MQKTTTSLSNRNLFLLLVFVFFMIWLPRASGLDTFVYIDEPSWVQRSANFYYALRHRQFERTAQNLSPGVTTMWAGAVGFFLEDRAYAAEAPGYFGEVPNNPSAYQHKYDHLEAFLLGRGVDPLDILAASRAVMVLLISLTLTFAFYFAVRLFGVWPSVVAFALIAFDPYYLVNSRFAHLDGPMSAFLLLSLLAFMNYLYLDQRRTFTLVISALAGAASWLSKQQGILILPTMLVLLAFYVFDMRPGIKFTDRLRSFGALGKYVKPLVLWGVIFIFAMIVAWPAMWQNPSGVLSHLIIQPVRYIFSSSGSAVPPDEAIEVIGEVGASAVPLSRDWFYYPRSFLWLTTPLVIIGLFLGLVAYLRRWQLLEQETPRRSYAALWIFALIFTFLIAISLKVANRYYLPFYLAMDILAGLGWYAAVGWLSARLQPRFSRWFAPAALTLVVAMQMFSSLPIYPYYVPYHNLLLGGNARASQLRYSGFGEGLELAADYLNQKPGAADLDVISWYAHGPFSSYFDGRSHDVQALTRDITALAEMDYLVTYRNSWQREYLTEYFALLDTVQPEYSVELFGIEYARIYAVKDLPPELFTLELQP